MTANTKDVSKLNAADQFDELLKSRWSCRAFRPDPVPDSTIKDILRTSQRTASWNNVQSWQVLITKGKGTERFRNALFSHAENNTNISSHFPFPSDFPGVYMDRRRACGFQLYEAVGVERGDKAAYAKQMMRNFALFDAPHVAVITTEEALGTYGAVDCGAYVANFLSAACSHGVATIAQGALAMHAEMIHDYFELPDNRRVVCGISFGYADESHPVNQYRVPRADIEDAAEFVES